MSYKYPTYSIEELKGKTDIPITVGGKLYQISFAQEKACQLRVYGTNEFEVFSGWKTLGVGDPVKINYESSYHVLTT